MQFPDPKAMIIKWRATKTFEKMGLGQITNAVQELEAEVNALRAGSDHFESKEWQWLTKTLLPNEHRRIAIARDGIPPDDAIKQAIAQGQINEILHLQSILEDVTNTITLLEGQLKTARETEARLRERSKKK